MTTKRMLVVDDRKDDVEFMMAAMGRQKIGCEFTVADDGQKALDWTARSFYEHFEFEPSPVDPFQMLLLMKDLRRAIRAG